MTDHLNDPGAQSIAPRASMPLTITFEAALTLIDKMSDDSKLRILDNFRKIASGFPEGRTAFAQAVNSEVEKLNMDLNIMHTQTTGQMKQGMW
jgi:hypothetical protein